MNRLNSIQALLTGLMMAGLLAAAPSLEARTKVVDRWQNEEAEENDYPQKIAVIAVLPDGLIREAFEIDVVKKLKTSKRNVVAASKLPGLSGGIRGEINTENAVKVLQQDGVDGVIVMFYAGGGVSATYERSNYWLEYEGTGVGYTGYNWGQPYFTDVYSVQQGPAITDFSQSALVESSYYDLETQEPVWRLVTETKDLEQSDAGVAIAKKINSEMKKAGL
ncbi:MAG: hypothetical protein SH820_00020 [Xanthomonadales bacterium]|nr:hypothetical protein [Xanthomonadales bacterium]